MDKYLTIKEAADLMKVDYKTIYRGIKSGRFQALQIGNVWRLPSEQFEVIRKEHND